MTPPPALMLALAVIIVQRLFYNLQLVEEPVTTELDDAPLLRRPAPMVRHLPAALLACVIAGSLGAGITGLALEWNVQISWSLLLVGIVMALSVLQGRLSSKASRVRPEDFSDLLVKTVDENVRWIGATSATVLGFIAAFSDSSLIPPGRVAVAALVAAVVSSVLIYIDYERLDAERTQAATTILALMAIVMVSTFVFGLLLIGATLVSGKPLTVGTTP